MTSGNTNENQPIGKLIILKQYFHPHYDWDRKTLELPEWLVLGHYDSVKTHKINKLKDLLEHTRVGTKQFEYGPNSQTYIPLILNSFYTGITRNEQVLDEKEESGVVFRLLIQMQLSAVTVDSLKRVAPKVRKKTSSKKSQAKGKSAVQFQQLSKGIDQIGICVQSILDDPLYSSLNPVLYRSMGADEFIAELTFAEESEFSRVFSLFQALKGIDFQKVIRDSGKHKNHHVFGRVNALVTFNRERIKPTGKVTSSSNPYKIVQHIRISPGHDEEALSITNRNRYSNWIGTNSKNMVIEFPGGFGEYVSVMRDQLTESIQNTGSVYSEFLFNPSTSIHGSNQSLGTDTGHKEISVGKPLKALKKQTVNKLKKLEKRKSFGFVQITEFNVLLNIATQGLLRNDKQVFLLDLIPYIKTIPDYLLGYQELVESGKLTGTERLRYLRAIDRTVAFLRRAIRNRIEEMANSGDPMSISNRSIVSPKLMAAYSICARVVWLFLKESFKDQSPCNACALVGTLGRVIVQEPLLGLRQRIIELRMIASEKNIPEEKIESEQAKKGGVPRLLFYDLSGPLLLRPEAVFLSTVHELAEHLEWKGPRFEEDFLGEFRMIVERATLERTAAYFVQDHPEFQSIEYQQALGLIINAYLVGSLESIGRDEDDFSGIDLIHELFSKADLSGIISLVLSELSRREAPHVNQNSVIACLKMFHEYFIQSRAMMVRPRATNPASTLRLMDGQKEFNSVVSEVFSDAAMFYFLRAARHITSQVPSGSCAIEHSDWFYVYYFMLEVLLFWSPDFFVELSAITQPKLSGGFNNPRLSEFFHRAIVLHYLVYRTTSKSFDVQAWEEACVSDVFKLYAKFCRDNKETVAKVLSKSIFSDYLKIQMLWLSELLIIPDQYDTPCIASLLWRQFDQNTYGQKMEDPESMRYLGELVKQFIDLWEACAKDLYGGAFGSENTNDTERQRVRFLEALWCESTFVDVRGLFR